MFNLTRLVLPLAILAAACADGSSSLPPTAPSNRPSRDVGGASASNGIQGVQDALNPAWAAKGAAGYPARVIAPAARSETPAARAGARRSRQSGGEKPGPPQRHADRVHEQLVNVGRELDARLVDSARGVDDEQHVDVGLDARCTERLGISRLGIAGPRTSRPRRRDPSCRSRFPRSVRGAHGVAQSRRPLLNSESATAVHRASSTSMARMTSATSSAGWISARRDRDGVERCLERSELRLRALPSLAAGLSSRSAPARRVQAPLRSARPRSIGSEVRYRTWTMGVDSCADGVPPV